MCYISPVRQYAPHEQIAPWREYLWINSASLCVTPLMKPVKCAIWKLKLGYINKGSTNGQTELRFTSHWAVWLQEKESGSQQLCPVCPAWKMWGCIRQVAVHQEWSFSLSGQSVYYHAPHGQIAPRRVYICHTTDELGQSNVPYKNWSWCMSVESIVKSITSHILEETWWVLNRTSVVPLKIASSLLAAYFFYWRKN